MAKETQIHSVHPNEDGREYAVNPQREKEYPGDDPSTDAMREPAADFELAFNLGEAASRVLSERNNELTFGRVEKPKRYFELFDLTRQTMRTVYPESYLINDEDVFWITFEGLKHDYEAKAQSATFTERNLESLGAKKTSRAPITDTANSFHDANIFPPHIYFVADEFNRIESNDLFNKSWSEYALVKTLATACILHSRTPRFVQYSDDIKDLLDRTLELERKDVPKRYPEINIPEFNKLVDGYRDLIDLDNNPLIELDGAAIKYLMRFSSQNEGEHDELLITGGVKLSWDIAVLLAKKPIAETLKVVANDYGDNRNAALKRYEALANEDAMRDRRTTVFLNSIGLAGNKDTFKAFTDSNIVSRFLEFNAKKKKLIYPL